uniref:Uncharacterized protein n=1 Tax=Amphimedon queenslandica TaxID=400682 RepID=A0A1X7V809_AMPQE
QNFEAPYIFDSNCPALQGFVCKLKKRGKNEFCDIERCTRCKREDKRLHTLYSSTNINVSQHTLWTQLILQV